MSDKKIHNSNKLPSHQTVRSDPRRGSSGQETRRNYQSRKRGHYSSDEGVPDKQPRFSEPDEEVIYTRDTKAGNNSDDKSNRGTTSREGEDQEKGTYNPTQEKIVETQRLCHYCGNDVLSDQGLTCDDNNLYHKDCISKHIPRCERAIEEFRAFVAEKANLLWIGIHVAYLYGQEEKDKTNKLKRAAKIKELLNKASALRNSDSGFILIHLVGLAPGDNFTGAFDEFADAKLTGLIIDGSSFDDVYKKQRLSALGRPSLETFSDILVLFVNGAKFLESSNLKTKSANDDSIIDMPDLTLLEFLRKRQQFEKQEPPVYTFGDLSQLHESRRIQAKAYFGSNKDEELVKSVFQKLKLDEYISAFSKSESGGSYFLGLEEKKIKNKNYISKILVPKPTEIENQREVEKRIREGVSQTILACDYDGKKTDVDLIRISFIPGNNNNPPLQKENECVVHVFVQPVSGIVFYDKEGPVAYKVSEKSENSISRCSLEEWFQAFKHRIQRTGN